MKKFKNYKDLTLDDFLFFDAEKELEKYFHNTQHIRKITQEDWKNYLPKLVNDKK